jgi:ABC-2 type transport system permease protein/sodium transport system permease protein
MIELILSGRLWRMCVKELRETLRDRRTIFTLILMPLLVYPVLSLALQRLILNSVSGNKSETVIVGVSSENDIEVLGAAIQLSRQLTASDSYRPFRYQTIEKAEATSAVAKPTPPPPPITDWNATIVQKPLKDSLEAGEIDLTVSITRRIDQLEDQSNKSDSGKDFLFSIGYRENDSRSEFALSEMRKMLQTLNEHEASKLRIANGLSRGAPFEMLASAIAGESSIASSLSSVIPLVLVLMTITGAVYPAIDLTAGERERGTMEALIATPISRFALLLSKYVAVLTVAVLTAMANLIAMFVTLRFSGLADVLLGDKGFSIWSVIAVFPLLIVFASFFSAILLALCSVAKSFKEAQAYLIPVIILSMGPGILSLLPSVRLTGTMAAIPLINMILMARECLAGDLEIIPGIIAVSTTLCYAIIAMAIASQLFGMHAVPQNSEVSWRSWLRAPTQLNRLPTLEHLTIYLAFFFPIYFVAIHLLASLSEIDLQQRVWLNATATVLLFGVLPLLFALWRKLSIQKTFPVGGASRWWLAIPGLLLISVSMWTVAHEILVLSELLGVTSLDFEKLANLEKAKTEFLSLPLLTVWISMAIIIAMAEEWFFRGFVLQGMLDRSKNSQAAWISILISAILFGLFHTVAPNLLAIERFLPTTALGIIIGWIAWKTGSLVPGMIVHAIHNGLLFTMPRYEDLLRQWGLGIENQKHLPLTWIAGGFACLAIGILMVQVMTKQVDIKNVENTDS